MRNRKWTNEQLIDAVKTSNIKSEVIRKLGLKLHMSAYRTVNKYLSILNIDTSHLISHDMSYQRSFKKKMSYDQIFINNSSTDYNYVRRVIIKNNLIPYICKECGINSWMGKNLTLHLDHINGIGQDHRLENLRFLCPNCHSQTETYCGKNCAKKKETKYCKICGKKIWEYATHCKKCSNKINNKLLEKIKWPSKEELLNLLKTHSFVQLGKILGVSDNAIRKRLKNH